MISFYEFYKLMESNNWERGYDSWKLSEPPGWGGHDWSEDDLEWTDWEDNSESVWLVNGQFVDSKRTPLPWLQPWVEEVKKLGSEDHKELPWVHEKPERSIFWPKDGMADHSKSIGIEFEVRYGYLRGGENPKTGESWEPETVAVEMKSPVLAIGDEHKLDLSSVEGKITSHFYSKYESLTGPR